ncbi:hypothetical protein [Nitrosococcus watsonii]|uniref:Uncharacterized protein n=1 Tax=Nitrosococcus watsoni (strain C-113) TaxID=105559 RepID=D8KC19_NITWC|nr:hypothetical protein [Nitrosococcus watsonii]ADJ29690.1 hypothetical protein Nwat_2953 [Nitrosococcus watsonii C-113]
MRRPYRELGKPFAVRTVELLQGLQLIAESIQKVREGEGRYLMVLSGQLRSLVAERRKGEVPLLLDVADKFGKGLMIYSMPGVEDPAFPEELRADLILHVTGFPVSLERQFPAQKAILLNEFLDQDLILFKGARYTPRKIIEWYANKAGGAHYASRIPEDFAALMTLNPMNTQPLANLLVQISEATLAAGRQLLRSVVEFEIYALVVIPEQESNAVQDVNYLFDSRYEGSEMRISMSLNARLMPSFFVSGLQGVWGRVDCDRLIDWSEPKLLHAVLIIEDDLSTTIELAVDGIRVGRSNVKFPLFVLSDPLDYESYHNRATDGRPQKFTFAVGYVLMIGRELGPEERANMLLYMSSKRTDLELRVICYSPEAFALVKRGTKHLTITGQAHLKLARDLPKFKAKRE